MVVKELGGNDAHNPAAVRQLMPVDDPLQIRHLAAVVDDWTRHLNGYASMSTVSHPLGRT